MSLESLDTILARLEARGAAKAGERLEPAPAAPVPVPALAPARLPYWSEEARGVPNAALRSALFCAVELGQEKREFFKGQVVFAQEGILIRFTGERLDQGDLNVFAAAIHIARLKELGNECRCTAPQLLKVLSITNTSKNRKTLKERIERLKNTGIKVESDGCEYNGSLLHEAYFDTVSLLYVIKLNDKLNSLFSVAQFTKIDWVVRRSLIGKPLAQWLHGYYSSHAKPYPITTETLKNLCGSETEELWKFTQTLRRALAALTAACQAHGQPFHHELLGDLVHVQRQASASQARHLARRAASIATPT